MTRTPTWPELAAQRRAELAKKRQPTPTEAELAEKRAAQLRQERAWELFPETMEELERIEKMARYEGGAACELIARLAETMTEAMTKLARP